MPSILSDRNTRHLKVQLYSQSTTLKSILPTKISSDVCFPLFPDSTTRLVRDRTPQSLSKVGTTIFRNDHHLPTSISEPQQSPKGGVSSFLLTIYQQGYHQPNHNSHVSTREHTLNHPSILQQSLAFLIILMTFYLKIRHLQLSSSPILSLIAQFYYLLSTLDLYTNNIPPLVPLTILHFLIILNLSNSSTNASHHRDFHQLKSLLPCFSKLTKYVISFDIIPDCNHFLFDLTTPLQFSLTQTPSTIADTNLLSSQFHSCHSNPRILHLLLLSSLPFL